MSETTTVEIPDDVRDNSETTTDYAFMQDRALTDYPYHTVATRDREIERVTLFPALELTHYSWLDVNPDGQRCRFDMIVNSDGVVVNLFHTEYWTRVVCAYCAEHYRGQSYAAYYTVKNGDPGDPAPLCDEHIAMHKRMDGVTFHLSERLLVGQHD